MKDEGVFGICVGTDMKTSEGSIELTKAHPNLFASVGLHPTHADDGFDIDSFSKLASKERVVAIGECGLDYFRKEFSLEEKNKQEETLRRQIDLSIDKKLPLMIHCRPSVGSMNAYEDLLSILRGYEGKDLNKSVKPFGNIHFFVGNIEIAQKFLDLGFTMSFTGVITFTNDYDEVIRYLPMDSIMTETDSPFVAPAPFRGKRNEPVYVKEVVSRIAVIKNLPEDEVKKAIIRNADRVFKVLQG